MILQGKTALISGGSRGIGRAISELFYKEGATIYITSAPCIECAKLIIQSGIKRVVYSEKYRVEDGCDLLQRAGIQIDFIQINQ